MKSIKVREWKDLNKTEKEEVLQKKVNALVEAELEFLGMDLNDAVITEEEYYERIGCSKSYAETTSWFVPSCYYEKHKKFVDEQAKEEVEKALYDKFGREIYL